MSVGTLSAGVVAAGVVTGAVVVSAGVVAAAVSAGVVSITGAGVVSCSATDVFIMLSDGPPSQAISKRQDTSRASSIKYENLSFIFLPSAEAVIGYRRVF